jgi:phosphodiesterase/alkaline phosphatase D-like protein
MKRLLVIGLALGLTTGAYATQDKLEGAEANVQITQQPQAIHVDGDSAILTWKTDSTAANNVLYRPVGSSEWKHAFLAKGSKDHWMKLSGLQPKTKYEYQVLTTSNKVRAAGQFETAAAGSSTTSSASPASASPKPAAAWFRTRIPTLRMAGSRSIAP